MSARAALLVLTLSLLLPSCAGYQLGASKPTPLAQVSVIHVEMVDNQTQVPRAAAYTTNALADALTRDGTYRLGTADSSDARLATTIHTIEYEQVRSSPLDSLASVELAMIVELEWRIIDSNNPVRILDHGESVGRTSFFAAPNLATARQTAITDAVRRATEELVARIANGF